MNASRNIGIGLGLYFNCFLCTAVLDLPKTLGYVVASGVGLATIAYALYVHDYRVSRTALMRWLGLAGFFGGMLTVSYALNFDEYNSALTFKVIGYFSGFAISSSVALIGGRSSARACLRTYWIGLLLAIGLTLAFNNVNSHNGRLLGPFRNPKVPTSGLHANEVGLLGMTAVLVAAEAGWPAVLLTAPVGLLIAHRSGCRGSIIGIFIAVLVMLAAKEFIARSRHRALDAVPIRGVQVVAGLLLTACLVGVFAGPFIMDRVLLLNDERRGLSSGFTGRWEQWEGLYRNWAMKPVFGRGYSIVRNEVLSAGEGADGGFLLVLAELGLFGLLYFLSLFLGAMKVCMTSIRRCGNSNEIAFLVFLVTFGFTNIFESRIVGAGSIGLGVFFFIVTLCLVQAPDSSLVVELVRAQSPRRRMDLHRPHKTLS